MKPFIRVKSKITGHQFDIHRQAFDPDRHELVKRVPDARAPRRPKYRVNYRTSAPKAVEAESSATPIESAGTEQKEVGP